MSSVKTSAQKGDKLLWVLGGGVGGVAMLSLVLLNLETSGDVQESVSITRAETTPTNISASAESAAPTDHLASTDPFGVRLNRAQLAYDAGMLLEPEGFSAWNLYSNVLTEDPGNTEAAEGLAAVANALVDRAYGAMSEGRTQDAEALVARVFTQFPDHEDALELASRTREVLAAVAPQPVSVSQPRARQTAPAAPAPAPAVRVREPEAPPVAVAVEAPRSDPVTDVYQSFTQALASARLLAPQENNASEFVTAMRVLDSMHPMTLDAEQQLFEAFIEQHDAAVDALDGEAAIRWLDAAESLNVDNLRIAGARDNVNRVIAAATAAESLPASELSMVKYSAPDYPAVALRLGVEGWVDVEFIVTESGDTTNVEVVAASHDNYFRTEAVRAVNRWDFEPRTVMGQVVEQKAHTRIRFVLK